jgi:transposase
LLLVGYFEGIDSERGIAWRAGIHCRFGNSWEFRWMKGPDHTTIARTRRLIDLETHRQVFAWVLELLADAGLVKGRLIGIDATTLEANAALRSIVRRDNAQSYEEFLKGLARQSGVETPTREDLARVDRKRKKKGSNREWVVMQPRVVVGRRSVRWASPRIRTSSVAQQVAGRAVRVGRRRSGHPLAICSGQH